METRKLKIAFLIPANKKCGVSDYSLRLLKDIMRLSKSSPVKVTPVYYENKTDIVYYSELAKKVSNEYDLIHLQHEFALFGRFGLGFLIFLCFVSKPLVVTFHEFHPKGLVGIKEKLLLFYKNKISSVLVLSSSMATQAEKFFAVSKIVNTGFGVEKKLSKSRLISKLVVHPGFVRENKNQLFTLALAKLLPEYTFVILGGGHGEYFEKVLSESKGLANVEVTGFVSSKKYLSLLSSAETVLLPYTEVAQSAAFYDALSFGKNILASDLDFFREMQSKGLLKCVALLPELFCTHITNPSSNKLAKINLIKFLDKNSFEEVALRNLEVYGELYG